MTKSEFLELVEATLTKPDTEIAIASRQYCIDMAMLGYDVGKRSVENVILKEADDEKQ